MNPSVPGRDTVMCEGQDPRFVYCPHRGQIAFTQRSPRIHLEPCKCCPDHPASRYTHLYRAAATIGRLANEGDVVLGRDAVVAVR